MPQDGIMPEEKISNLGTEEDLLNLKDFSGHIESDTNDDFIWFKHKRYPANLAEKICELKLKALKK